MKKKSILLTCIVAIMALAMFVGCDNAPELPSFVVSGSIDQTGDFLTGQNFDPKKFSVTVTYDNGKIVPADETVSVYLTNGAAKVYGGEPVVADLGRNYDSQPVTVKGTVSVYNINRIEVAGGPESYVSVGGATPEVGKSSDYTVTAYYYDSDNVEKSMVLGSTEYDVEWGNYVDEKASALNPSVAGKLKVTVNVGGTVNSSVVTPVEFYEEITVAFQAAAVKDIAKLDSGNTKWTGTLPELNYNESEMPTPSFDDIELWVVYAEATSGTKLPVDPGVKLSFVEADSHEALASYDMTAVEKIQLEVAYEGVDPIYVDVTPAKVNLKVQPVYGYALTVGDKLESVDPEDFIVDLYTSYDSKFIERLNSEDVTFAYTDTSGRPLPKTQTVSATTDQIKVSASYIGAAGSTDVLDINEAPKKDVVEITGIKLNSKYVMPGKQYYDDLADVEADLSILESITVEVTPAGADKANDPVTITADKFGDAVKVAFSTNSSSFKSLEDSYKAGTNGYDLSEVDKLYLQVTYTNENGVSDSYLETTGNALNTAVATKLIVTTDYQYKSEVNGQPMLESPVTFTVMSANDYGVVNNSMAAAGDTGFKLMVAGKTVSSVEVGAEAQTVTVYATNTDGNNQTIIYNDEAVTIPAGQAYIAKTSASVAPSEDYDKLIDHLVSVDPDDYVLSGYTVTGSNTLKPEVKIVVPEGQVITSGSNSIRVEVSYTTKSGALATDVLTCNVTGTDWDAPANVALLFNDKPIENNQIVGGETKYTIDGNFKIATGSFESHDTTTATITSVKPSNLEAITDKSAKFIISAGQSYVFTISYTGENGPATATVTINGVNA